MKKLSLKMVALIAAMMMCLTAEAKTEDVGGRVIDMQGEPLPFVSVALLTADSTYIQGATSDVDGYFQIQTTDACCILRFSYIGYRTKYVNVNQKKNGIRSLTKRLFSRRRTVPLAEVHRALT